MAHRLPCTSTSTQDRSYVLFSRPLPRIRRRRLRPAPRFPAARTTCRQTSTTARRWTALTLSCSLSASGPALLLLRKGSHPTAPATTSTPIAPSTAKTPLSSPSTSTRPAPDLLASPRGLGRSSHSEAGSLRPARRSVSLPHQPTQIPSFFFPLSYILQTQPALSGQGR